MLAENPMGVDPAEAFAEEIFYAVAVRLREEGLKEFLASFTNASIDENLRRILSKRKDPPPIPEIKTFLLALLEKYFELDTDEKRTDEIQRVRVLVEGRMKQ